MLDQLKPIMQNGERYIIVENGKPEYVVMRFQDYSALVAGMGERRASLPRFEVPSWERANAEFAEAKPQVHTAAAHFGAGDGVPSFAPDPGAVRLEDLPL